MTDYTFWPDLENVFREVFDAPDLKLRAETTADDVEDWDSLTNIQLLVAVEQKFGVRFNTGEIAGLKNVGEMAALITERTGRE
jgi:acyl carrier protein